MDTFIERVNEAIAQHHRLKQDCCEYYNNAYYIYTQLYPGLYDKKPDHTPLHVKDTRPNGAELIGGREMDGSRDLIATRPLRDKYPPRTSSRAANYDIHLALRTEQSSDDNRPRDNCEANQILAKSQRCKGLITPLSKLNLKPLPPFPITPLIPARNPARTRTPFPHPGIIVSLLSATVTFAPESQNAKQDFAPISKGKTQPTIPDRAPSSIPRHRHRRRDINVILMHLLYIEIRIGEGEGQIGEELEGR